MELHFVACQFARHRETSTSGREGRRDNTGTLSGVAPQREMIV